MQKSRIDKFISTVLSVNKREVKLLLARKKVMVDDIIITDAAFQINKFSVIAVNNKILQREQPMYIMLHKPVGVVSATKDEIHKTVIDLLHFPNKETLHIVGRLDLNTSGLMLLTNDSRWSERLTLPQSKVPKVYQVTLKDKLTQDYIAAFKQGMYFEYEDITTAPAILEIMSDYVAKVILMEGKYHQIKRMFGRFSNQVMQLHRSKIGSLDLDINLKAGESRELTADEVENIFS
ncbi:pseudouridine synthase [Pseudocolwellia sp. HL-MZ19]|uniref:pseudouridine synthase n=1 Tax=Pseudocolwellia sp. HL-MZ19 TaxID=3400846 RepID=UPI003CF8699E